MTTQFCLGSILEDVERVKLSSKRFVGKVQDAVVLRAEMDDDGVETLVDATRVFPPRVADGTGQLVGAVRIVAHVRCRDLECEC